MGDLKESTVKSMNAPHVQIFLLGLGMILGGMIRLWNDGLQYGLTTYLICWSIVVVLYYLLVLCIAEMTSIAAFSGGSYAFVRTGISPFIGYIVGFSELMQHNFFAIASTYHLGKSITYFIENSISSAAQERTDYAQLEPLWFFLCYLTVLPIHLRGGTFFWKVMSSLTIITVLIVLLYIFSVMTMTDTVLDPDHMHSHHEGIISHKNNDPQEITMNVWEKLISPTWMFFGIETMTISCSKISNGRQVLPPTILAVMTTATVTSLVLIFLVYLTRPDNFDELISTSYPLSFGLKHALDIPVKYTALLIIVANYASLVAFSYASTNLLYSMALSGLVPEYFRELYSRETVSSDRQSGSHHEHHHHNDVVSNTNTGNNNTNTSSNVNKSNKKNGVPLRALITCLLIQFIIACVRKECYDGKASITFRFAVISASIVYMGIFAAYIQFKRNFNNLDRTFLNPFHIPGAVVGIILSILLFISAAFLQEETNVTISYFVILFGGIVYYKCIAEKKQYFSAEEQQKFMKAYILNANKRMKKNKMKKVSNLGISEEEKWNRFYNKLWYMLLDPLGYMRDAIFTSRRSGDKNTPPSQLSSDAKASNMNSPVNKTNNNPLKDNYPAKSNAVSNAEPTNVDEVVPSDKKSTRLLTFKVASATNLNDNMKVELGGAVSKTPTSVSIHSTASINNDNNSAERRLALNWSGKVMDSRQSRQFFEIIDELDTSNNNNNNNNNNKSNDNDVQEEIGIVLKLTQKLPDHFELVIASNSNNNHEANGVGDVDIEVGKSCHDNGHTVDSDHHHHHQHIKHNTVFPL